MAIKRWNPAQTVSRKEQFILGRLKRNGKLYAFLRLHRHQLFDDAFQVELEAMYRDTGAGKEAHPPAFMAMVLLLQSYAGASDATAVEPSLLDLRWQMVLDCLGDDEPRFSQGIDALYIDRGYINSPIVDEIRARRGAVICRPWVARNGAHFSKRDFSLNLRERTITCPAGEQQPIVLGTKVQFPAQTCAVCPLRAKCTDAGLDRGRSVEIADNELLQQRLRKRAATSAGRQELRERVPVEYRQAHTCRRQGRHARFIGSRKNEFDLRRVAAVSNLELIQRRLEDRDAQAAPHMARAA